jgi:hypothetical protein
MDYRDLLIEYLVELAKNDVQICEDCVTEDDTTLGNFACGRLFDLQRRGLLDPIGATYDDDTWTLTNVTISPQGRALSTDVFVEQFMGVINDALSELEIEADDMDNGDEEQEVYDMFMQSFNVMALPLHVTRTRTRTNGCYWYEYKMKKRHG